MSTFSFTTPKRKNPIQRWGLSADIRDLDTIMICLTSSGSVLSSVDVVEVLQRRNPSKYGAMKVKDVEEVFNFCFSRWNSADVPWGLWAERVAVSKDGGTASEDMARRVEVILAGAKDELGTGAGEQGGAGKETKQVAEGGVEGVGDGEEAGCAGRSEGGSGKGNAD
ncbi:MAG: hypothetical protein ALECFALPRED_001608 [Alectoria fallacina]|uniref:Uncharacterized protein n=1 Tax=Alectoria fallacina TaxID=1903189 RepID=A0A8H3IJ49_9LECA|nr:MAG: hypothetical protein ALECFALPRED_001608 [Alectoria fallacina]